MFHLYYAFSDRRQNGFNQSTRKILKLANVKTIEELAIKAGYSDTNPVLKKTSDNILLKQKPPHVVFVLMEGWTSHIAMSDSASNPVLGAFKAHAQQDYFLPYFFSNQSGTNPTIENILMNSPITPLSQSSGYKTKFSMSNLLPFKRAGYQTTFLSGGASSWRNHGLFWTKQGFDKYIGRSIIEDKYQVKADNPWGVYDEYLFRYLEESLLDQKAPSFSFVLTTNNHPPVKLPSDYISPEFDAALMDIDGDRNHQNSVLQGYRYQTDALGQFLSWLKNSELKNDVIVVATGDHVLKGFGDYQSIENQFARYAVATYLYIPEQYDQLNTRSKQTVNALFGSHADLMPTIFELALSNASYYDFGTSLMHKTKNNAYGWITQDALIDKQGIVDTKTNKVFPWDISSKIKLTRNIYDANQQQLETIQQEHYRRLYKMWLLYNDKEQEQEQEQK